MRKIVGLLTALALLFMPIACAEDPVALQSENLVFPEDTAFNLSFNANKTFRILQLTDVHYDQSNYGIGIMQNIEKLVNLSRPDLIVLTGDIVSGQPATYRWIIFASFLSQLHYPYVIALGNHDSEHFLTRRHLYEMIRHFPNCENEEFEDGSAYLPGDMAVEIKKNASSDVGALLYLFDTNEYSNPEKQLGIRAAQTDWFEKKDRYYKDKGVTGNIPGLVFMHVPLTEYRTGASLPDASLVGARGEKEYTGLDSHAFFEALKRAGDIQGVFCGHDHFNEYVLDYQGIALCYGRKSGSHNTYQRYPTGARVIDLHEGEAGFFTFILECDGSRHHEYLY